MVTIGGSKGRGGAAWRIALPAAMFGLALFQPAGPDSSRAADPSSKAQPAPVATRAALAATGTDDCQGSGIPIPVPGMTLKFKSGFEDGVSVSHRLAGRQSVLSGSDASGYSWDRLSHVFLYVSLGATYRGLVTTEIRADRAHCGKRSLYMSQNVVDGDAQNRLQFYGNDDEFGTEILTRRWYYFDDLDKMLNTEHDDTSVGGTREFGIDGHQDFSVPLYIIRQNGKLMWRVAGVDYDAGTAWSQWTRGPRGFIVDNGRIPVPNKRWFLLDVYIKRHEKDGAVKAWLDGQVLFDIKGVRTKSRGKKWFSKLADYDGTKPGFLWVDDVAIYGR